MAFGNILFPYVLTDVILRTYLLRNICMVEKLEKDIQREILEMLNFNHLFFWRSNNIPVFGRNNAGHKTFRSLPKFTPKGLPDIIVIYHGNFIGLEVKRPTARLTTEQTHFYTQCRENGGFYYKVTSVDEVKEVFARDFKKTLYA